MTNRVSVNGQSFEVNVLSSTTTEMEPEVDGRTFLVEFEKCVPSFENSKRDSPTSPAFSPTLSTDGQKDVISAPMPGIITAILVEPGQAITKGQALLRYEAMKMDNVISTASDSSVKEIFVVVGQEISSGQILLALE